MGRTSIECVLLAGFGGMAPTLSKLAAASVADPSSPLPAIGFYVGLGIYFVIGAVMAYAFAERNVKQAFFAGIAAPAIIASVLAGAATAPSQATPVRPSAPSVSGKDTSFFLASMISSAKAQEKAFGSRPDSSQDSRAQQTPAEPIEPSTYKYLLTSFPSGSSDWRPSAINVKVTVKDTEGKLTKYTLPGLFAVMNLQTERPISEVMLEAQGVQTSFISLGPNKGGDIFVRPHVETKKDLLWALGGKGAPVVREFSAQLVTDRRP